MEFWLKEEKLDDCQAWDKRMILVEIFEMLTICKSQLLTAKKPLD